MSKDPIYNLRLRVSVLAKGLSNSAFRVPGELVDFLYSASKVQFKFNRDLADDFSKILKNRDHPAEAMQTLLTKWHDRSEIALKEFPGMSDVLRNKLYESIAKPVAKANETEPEDDEARATSKHVPSTTLATHPLGQPSAPGTNSM